MITPNSQQVSSKGQAYSFLPMNDVLLSNYNIIMDQNCIQMWYFGQLVKDASSLHYIPYLKAFRDFIFILFLRKV